MKKHVFGSYLLGVCIICQNALAQEMVLKIDTNIETSVSIYNQNMAMVRDVRKVDLPPGISKIAFEGVARQMQPETSVLSGNEIAVLEKNYEYDLLSYNNILEESVGQKVKTVTLNPQTGANIFDEAVLISSNYGSPLLKFDYGIEGVFPGRVVFENLPKNLRVKPTLVAKILSENGGQKDLRLSYLTGGLNWQADYAAEIADNGTMFWQGWVNLDNQSGADYKNASIKLVSGDVNVQNNAVTPQPRVMLAAKSMATDMVNEASVAGGMPAQSLGEYYVYKLPFKTDILDKQSKQVKLMDTKTVKYKTIYKLESPLFLSTYGQGGEFKRVHPDLIYKIINDKENGLGLPMPEGTVRFYEKGSDENIEFVGAAKMPQLADGAETELAVGKSFDLYAEGKVINQQKIAEKTSEFDVKIIFYNAKEDAAEIIFEQAYSGNISIVAESLESTKEQANVLQWKVNVPAKGKVVLTYKLRLSRN